MATQLEAKYRISLLLDDALKALREFRQGLDDIGGTNAAGALNQGLDATAAKVKEVSKAQDDATAEQVAAAKAAADAELAIKRDQAAREKALAQQAAAEAKATQAQQLAAAKAAAAEALAAKKQQAAQEAQVAKDKAAAEKAAAAESLAAAKKQAADEAALAKQQAADAAAAIKKQQDAQKAADKQASTAAYQQRLLAPQLTDIVVGLSTGQSPFTVLLQQGGQLKDVFGGIVPALKAVGELFTVTRIAAGLLAGAIGTVAYAIYDGWQQSDALNKSLALTGNIANVTAASLDQSARSIANNQKVSISSVRETLQAALDTGTFIGPTLDSAGRAAVALSKLTGKSAADQVADFAAMSSGVAAWAAKQNQAYNFLTAGEYEHIRSLEAAGRQQEAMRDVLDKLSGAMTQRATPAVGYFAQAWKNVKTYVSDAYDALANFGRDKTIDERIAALQKKLANLEAAPFLGDLAADVRAQLDALLSQRNHDLLRDSEGSIDAQTNQDEIEKKSQAYQAALAQIELEGSKKILGQVQAGLDARQAVVDSANARGLLSARDYSLKLNAIDQQRTQAMLDEVNRQIKIEQSQKPGTPTETKAQEARLQALNNQIADLQSKLRTQSAAGRDIVSKDALDQARDDAQKWADAWQSAATQVRTFTAQNAAVAATQISDPIARADAEAKARVASLRQQLADSLRDVQLRIDLTVDPDQKAALQKQLNDLRFEVTQQVGAQTDAAKQASLRTQWGEATDALASKERSLDMLVEQGAITTEQAEKRKFDARQAAIPQLETLLAALEAIAKTPADLNAIEVLKQKITELKQPIDALGDTVRGSVKSEFGSLFSDIITGTQKAGAAFKSFILNVAKAGLDLIGQRLGEQIANSLLPKSGSSGGGFLSTVGNFVSTLFTHHSGGVVGASGVPRTVGIGAIAAAMMAPGGIPRYHTGGIVGYDPRTEELAVLKDGEEVLTEDNPRHIKNFRGATGGGIGDINVSVAVNGAKGDTADLQGAGNRLGDMMRSTINQWAADESREGGILAGRRS